MQIGVITVDGRQIGVVGLGEDSAFDTFIPDLDGYVPQGRAAEAPEGHGQAPSGQGRSPRHHAPPHHAPAQRGQPPSHDQSPPKAKPEPEPAPPKSEIPRTSAPEAHAPEANAPQSSASPRHGAPFSQGSRETDQAIVDAAKAHHLDVNTMRSIASIESGMNPSSNAHNNKTQYKGLYQVGREEWQRFGNGENIYSAKSNAFATARMFEANRDQFKKHFGRDPSDTELYLMHQQGLGFYTKGAMTNIKGNPYPGMKGPQSHASFEAGWGREIARRKAGFAGTPTASSKPVFDPGSDAL